MNKHSFKSIDRYKWWQIRHRLARFGWKSFLVLAFMAAVSWLNNLPEMALYFFYLSLVALSLTICMLLIQLYITSDEIAEEE